MSTSPAPANPRAATGNPRLEGAVAMTPGELGVMKAYCRRVWPTSAYGAMPGDGADFKTEDVFVALSGAFSYWCAESLAGKVELPHEEFMLRSALFNTSLGREMQRRNDDLKRAATGHLKEIAKLRARLELLEQQVGETTTAAKKSRVGAKPSPAVDTPKKCA